MATQSWIIGAENDVVELSGVVSEIVRVATLEAQQGGNEANRDCWGTLAVNLDTLRHRCNLAIERVEQLNKR